LLGLGSIDLAIDDTLAQKRGPRVWGASMHVEPVTSTKKRKNLVRGHCWVELGVVVNVPWSRRAWFIPLLSRLYRGKKEAGDDYAQRSASWLASQAGGPGLRRFLLLSADALVTIDDGKRRVISAAPFPDRIVHQALSAAIGPLLDPFPALITVSC
jgi:hypothetical protein